MKVEIVSIGTELLVSDIIDTNAAFISRSLREVKVYLTSKVTVGDNPVIIADAFRVALRRADVVISTGGLGDDPNDFTRQAISELSGREILPELPGIAGAKILGDDSVRLGGVLIKEEGGTLICLPGSRRRMAYILETEVMPYLRRQIFEETKAGWTLLRSVGMMESTLKQELSDLATDAQHQVTFDSFAGQTNIRLWVQGDSEGSVQAELDRMEAVVIERLGDHIFGRESDRLEDVVFNTLMKNDIKITIAECHTNKVLDRALTAVAGLNKAIQILPAHSMNELAAQLTLEAATENKLTQWCRSAAERIKNMTGDDLGLVIYKNVTQGGVQILVTLASPNGVSITQRSFGGHPENINQWALTLCLYHLRRWLLIHY